MIVKRRSQLTHKNHEMDLPVTEEQMNEFFDPKRKRLIQEIFPELNDEQREFILSGITPEEWVEFGGEEDI